MGLLLSLPIMFSVGLDSVTFHAGTNHISRMELSLRMQHRICFNSSGTLPEAELSEEEKNTVYDPPSLIIFHSHKPRAGLIKMLPFPSEQDHGYSKHRNQERDENSISAFYGLFTILLENCLILTEKVHVHTESITSLSLLFQQVIIVRS